MWSYILQRLGHAVFVLVGVSLIVFVTIRLTGDPVMMLLRDGNPSQEDIAEMRRLLDLDKPLPMQYVSFISKAITGDFGRSFHYSTPALGLVLERMPATITLTLSSMVVALLVAFPMGIISAVARGRLLDLGVRLFSLIGISMPNFWLGIILIIVFSVRLRWLPVSGNDSWRHLILPSVALGLSLSGSLTRLLRSSMLDVLAEDYVRTARAKGLSSRVVLAGHALRNALIPVLTILGLQFGLLLGGAVIVENVFSWPGVGRLVVNSIGARDYPVVQAAVIFLALILLTANLLVDILYTVVDPRVTLRD
ncbi:MAG: ABC transporter permease [Caldilineaceae bacterium]